MLAKRTLKAGQIIGIVMVILIAIVVFRFGYLNSATQLQTLVLQAGIWAPLVFILLQVIQVTFPIIPGGLSTVAAVAIFGPLQGFIYNYVGISIGSIVAFCLVRRFGQPVVNALVPDKYLEKYGHYLNGGQKFERLFALAILLPVAPDDILCMLAGLTSMSARKFITIIILCKPWTILAYSLGMNTLFAHLLG